MTKEKAKKGFIVRALDTVERVGNGLPNPATIFLILTGIVIVLSAICAALGVSVTYDFLDSASGEPECKMYRHTDGIRCNSQSGIKIQTESTYYRSESK